ncbi:MAG: DUF2933 domain-containing protein [Burkholderiales bacterium]|nr:DUF2933 domain-containing protein [Burkholderiales bacterium]
MTTPWKQTGTESGHAWRTWTFWIFAGAALLLLVLEHRAHVLGWWLHALLGLCVVLLYLIVRFDNGNDSDGARKRGPR